MYPGGHKHIHVDARGHTYTQALGFSLTHLLRMIGAGCLNATCLASGPPNSNHQPPTGKIIHSSFLNAITPEGRDITPFTWAL